MLPHRVIEASRSPVPFNGAHRDNFTYRWGFFNKSVQAYFDQWPATGLLICRGQEILVEQYRHARTPDMRLTSWSMAKSVTSLLLGICLDRKLIDSYDDFPSKYVPELAGTLHGSTTLRNLSNMSSGAEVLHDRDNSTIYPSAFTTKTANVFRTVANWNQRREAQGLAYNYNELCPLTLGIVIRKVTGMSMSEFAQQALWQPLGAEANATWTTDAERNEFNCIGFAATLRDWARLGNLVANRGQMAGQQVVSDAWITECTTWGHWTGRCATAWRCRVVATRRTCGIGRQTDLAPFSTVITASV
jgi:CubicO group peptidase (beta-lactamase class C family)